MHRHAPSFLAVDGGGSSCRFALLRCGTRTDLRLGSANASSNADATVATLRDGFAGIAAAAGLPLAEVTGLPVYLCLAGIVDESDAAALGRRLGLPRARIEDDRRAAVRGALGAGDGFVAALGTGSFFARQGAGAIRLAGGWGWRLGDEASGYWLARAALARTLIVADGLAPETELTRALIARHEGKPGGIVRFATGASPGEIAALAPLVADAADAGDPMGLAVLSEAAAHVGATLAALGWREGAALCLVGGLGPRVARHLPAAMADALAPPLGAPLEGAISLARDFAIEAGP